MDIPVCPAQYFANKQNVRSYRNIIKSSILKSGDSEFLKHLFENEDYLANYLNEDLVALFSAIKKNTRVSSKNDFHEDFKIDKNNNLQTADKEFVYENCCKVLGNIIPKQFFGNNSNRKVFRNLIQTVVYSMRRQHIVLAPFIEKWNFTLSPWQNIPISEVKKILYYILIWILKNILAAMICLNFYVTSCKIDSNENKLHFFWKKQWQSFYDKKISDMIFTKIINKYEPYCLGKKLKRNHNFSERLRLKLIKKDIPKLHLVLKSNNDFRPIVRYRNDSQNLNEKYKMRERLKFLKMLSGKSNKRIEFLFIELYQKWSEANRPKLYFIKTDLSNAFGSVNKEKLIKILSERHMSYQKIEKNVILKKRMAQHYKETMTELRKPLLVRAGSTVFEWKEGLVQGYKYSPALSEVYYTYMDQIYFSEHLKKSENHINLFTRAVDDYLYITDSLEDAHAFLNALFNYRNVNNGKTVVNFEHSHIKYSEEITFLGYSYNTKTMEVSRAVNVFVGDMCYRIAFSNAIQNIAKFLENRIGQSGIQINTHIFNFLHNPEDLIWKHIFTTFCLSANKFCTILAVLCNEKEMLNYLTLYKKRVVVKLSNNILETLMKNPPVSYKFMYCINHLHYLSWKALYLCAKGTPKCSGLVPQVNVELNKTNCLFGKWQEHGSSINTSGCILKSAVKEICRRSDLRAIVKQFDSLPEGFECYNHRKIVNKTNL